MGARLPDDPLDSPASAGSSSAAIAWRAPVLYPSLYALYVLVSAADLVFTWLILNEGGREVNFIADWVLAQWNIRGLVAFKFLTVVVVLLICEGVGRRRQDLGAQLARWAVVISAFPVVVGGIHVVRIAMGVTGHPPASLYLPES